MRNIFAIAVCLVLLTLFVLEIGSNLSLGNSNYANLNCASPYAPGHTSDPSGNNPGHGGTPPGHAKLDCASPG
jgi:hypothetical protein